MKRELIEEVEDWAHIAWQNTEDGSKDERLYLMLRRLAEQLLKLDEEIQG